jgi:CRISPR-associated RAMP protein (TIGR02581 family)
MSFEKLTSRVIIRAQLIAGTGLHIGAGSSSIDPSATDSPVIRDARGLPFIPGSSLKGALRSHLESLVRGLGREDFWSCDPIADPCVPAENRNDRNGKPGMKEIKEAAEKAATPAGGQVDRALYDEQVTRDLEKQTCTVCKLFGSPWLSSRILFKDSFVSDPGLTRRVDLRDGVGIDRDTETARGGVKYDFEVVPPTAAFSVEVVVENADVDEHFMGLLALGLREMEHGRVTLGGKTTRGLGRVRLAPASIELIDGAGLFDYLIAGEGKIITDAALRDYLDTGIRRLAAKLKAGSDNHAQEAAQ